MENSKYDGVILWEFFLIGDVIFVRIFRGVDSIVFYGDMRLKFGDCLIVIGFWGYVMDFKKILEG